MNYKIHKFHSLSQEKFIQTLEVIVRRKSSMKMVVNEEWRSEKEMKDDLKWTAFLVLKRVDWDSSQQLYHDVPLDHVCKI